ncbi:PPOX class F420-dependent oxidoreductase [Gordonia sp. NB41Y]|uniref:PPOX class F420-dependent oxidoreductase n=1 Tax=Gordonia sp. NB41Y TaxID=875808 RepID=UPI0006B1E486|nr:PPOX class F420-dependent oxidoreductase [Gordonia sp. NB41Y]KOY49124.1 pyridoxamine 5'-phosphate oxidase [Gordonia sp. NB41Y]WLP88803.1 PPOX class F420-dependent oxidoreductase [Gordonia sp. NB41Y]
MARTIATTDTVDLTALLEFVRPRHRMLLGTTRADGRVQLSPVSGGVDDQGRLVIATYPGRAKTANARRRPAVTVCIVSDEWNGPWVQIDGTAEVLDMPDAEDGLVDYFRSIAGEHSDWDEYRAAMRLQNKSLIRVTPTSWGPIATGGFPAGVAADLDARDAQG